MEKLINNYFGEYHLVLLSSASASETAFAQAINRAQFDVIGEMPVGIDVNITGMRNNAPSPA